MRYFILVGEASGDLHAANLMRSIKVRDPHAEFCFWGGDQMTEVAGNPPRKHYRDLAFMGFIEVVANLGTVLGNLRRARRDIDEYAPDALILVDYPGFNLRIARWAKKQNLRVHYYISPQIWAWKQSRVHAIKRDVYRMLTILPFESDFYRMYGVEVDFVGHPLLDALENLTQPTVEDVLGHDDGRPVIALLPGSRKQEVRAILPTMMEMVERFPDYRFVVAGAPGQDNTFYNSFNLGTLQIITNRTYDLLSIARAALVASGTATLETALFRVPQVVCYKGSRLSYSIARRLVKVAYISLVNLIADRKIVTELIQNDMNTESVHRELTHILDGPGREQMLEDYDVLRKLLGGPGASDRAAELIIGDLKS